MSILEIVTLENPVLRAEAAPVTQFDDDLRQLVADMVETMRDAPGVGLAAPQINRSIQLTVVESIPLADEQGEPVPDSRQLFVLVNPEIVWYSDEIVTGVEGCLSIPGWLGEVDRYQKIRVRAQDEYGRLRKITVSGWTARIFQHEIDHLHGILYIDRLTDPENFWPDDLMDDEEE